MSSVYVRTQIKNFITANVPSETIIDLTAQYQEIAKLLNNASLSMKDPWLGIQFIGADETPVSVQATNTTGLYRETGAIYLHIVEATSPNLVDNILARSEALRDALRGQRIGDIIIESVDPPNFENGATLEFEGGYTSASVVVGYYRDLKL